MFQMPGGMVAYDVDNRGLSPACIVQVCQTIAQSWSQMQQCSCGPVPHARVTICCACRHTFKQTEYASHFVGCIQSTNERDF